MRIGIQRRVRSFVNRDAARDRAFIISVDLQQPTCPSKNGKMVPNRCGMARKMDELKVPS